MVCCIVSLLLMASVGRIRRLFGARPRGQELPFAPVAWRPAPGETAPPAWAVRATEPENAGPRGAPVFGYCAAAITLALLGAPALVLAGVLQNTGSAGGWLVRTGCYAAVAAAAVVLGRSTGPWRAPRGPGTFLVILGAIVFELGVLDMHVFRIVAVDRADLVAMTVFHNIGPALAIIGGMLLGYRSARYASAGRSSTSWRSSRSTSTNARPSSSAVTVSCTPPLTR